MAGDLGRSSLFIKRVWDAFYKVLNAWIWSKQIVICTTTCRDSLIFQFIFTFVTDFECFNRPAIQEGVVCSWYMYGMHFRGDQVLELSENRFVINEMFGWDSIYLEALKYLLSVLFYIMSFKEYLGYKWDVLMRLNIFRSVLNID